MILATELRTGTVIKLNDELYRVTSAEYHAGGGKLGGVMHAKAKNLRNNSIRELKFHPDERLEDVLIDRREMEYLYTDGESIWFMDSQTFEQITLPKEIIADRDRFLQPDMRIALEFYQETPVHVLFPETVDLKVVTAPPGLREHDTTTSKSVTLENGMDVLVPQFIKEGEIVRIEVETGKYLERVKLDH